MEKKFILFTVIIFSFALLSLGNINDINKRQSENSSAFNIPVLDSKFLDAGNIRTWFVNNGSFNRDPSTLSSGFEWPKGSNKYARYASGLWIGAQVGIDTLVAIAEFDYEYLPGYIDNSGTPQGSADPLYRIYKIERWDTVSIDYMNWPVNQGAYLNESGRPYSIGSQTMFYSYTDGYPSAHGNNAGSTLPLKAVIMQTNWSYIDVSLRDVVFTEYRIINRNNLPWTNAYISIWTDDDLGGAADDAVGVDTNVNMKLGYTYNFDNDDLVYGMAPPAVGFTLLRHPIVQSIGDTVKYYSPPGSNNLITKPNYKQQNFSSFNMYSNGDPSIGDPQNFRETYFNLQGLKRDGSSWINPVTTEVTTYPFSGDPVISTGWIQTEGNDRRSLMTFGPLTMNPNDTQSVIFAQVIARGTSNLNSINRLRELTNYVQYIYLNNFPGLNSIKNISSEIPEEFKLEQNYPNPFNPSTVISYHLSAGDFISLKVYDALGNEVATLVNKKQNAGSYEVIFKDENLPSGVYYYILTSNGISDTKRMILLK